GNTDTATVTINVTEPRVGENPVAVDDEYTTEVDTPLTIDAPGVLGNDSDPDGDDLVVIAFDTNTTEGGTVEMNEDGSFTYTPPSGFIGTDTFTYTISDGNGNTDTATVTIIITESANSNPDAVDDNYVTEINTPIAGTAPGVLINDSDPEGDDLTVIAFDATSTQGGTVNVNPDGSFTYTPPTDFVGTDTFTYTISDGNGGTDTATVTIVVSDPNPNTDPDAVDDEYETDMDTPLTIEAPGVLINDSDPEGDELTVIEFDGTSIQGGTVEMNPDGSFTYTPPAGFVGTDTFTYTISDGNGGSDTATVTIIVKEVPLRIFNAFSPNGDGQNDVWEIQGIRRFPNNEVQIFNRWGNLVYKIRGYDNTARVWRGQSNEGIILGDKEVPDGSYFYVIDLGDGSKAMSGFVVIHR
ncbi:MAG: Ig-like domain-containing protein, partial [Cyclobacteriaceae bacterium]|nr:Ig-like domain-containing protein [Cyclobacteriaceae bacterium]